MNTPQINGEIDRETMETMKNFLLSWAPNSLQKVIVAMKLRHLLLGRKAMISLDSIIKSRDITLRTMVKAMFFPVVMYGCKSWTTKKAECQGQS